MRLDRRVICVVFALAVACGGGGGGGGGGDNDAGPDNDGGGGQDGGSDNDAGPDDDGGSDADAAVGCGLVTCEIAGATCGEIGDGCDSVLQCGTCDAPETCGGGAQPSQCGGDNGCVLETCETQSAECGPVGDGCGGTIASCGSCGGDAVCGGGGVASVCSETAPCEGSDLCDQIPDCGLGVTTSVSGIVYTPAGAGGNHELPLYNISVYVPKTLPLPGIDAGNTGCAPCDAPVDALVKTTTDANGNFTLGNMPAGNDIPLVIQSGKWRRYVTIDNVPECVNTQLGADLTRFPRMQGEDGVPENNVPRIAVTTGGADALECLIRKIGIDDSEFTQPAGTGRVNLYAGHGGTNRYQDTFNGDPSGDAFPQAQTLWDSANGAATNDLNDYDMVVLSCEGANDFPAGWPSGNTSNPGFRDASDLQAMKDYLDLYGGRVFASHWHHSWVEHGPDEMSTVADFTHRLDLPKPHTVTVNQGFPKGQNFAQWLFNVGASAVLGALPLVDGQHTVDSVDEDLAFRWVSGTNPDVANAAGVQYMSFNTPINDPDEEKCGRMVVTDIHVAAGDDSGTAIGLRFPGGCTSTTLLPEEKALIFMLFDLASCVTTDIPECEPQDCVDVGATCGQVADGCGGLISCGDCEEPDTCGGGGVPYECGNDGCIGTTCEAQEAECGYIPDGCGGSLNCGECTPPDTCGGSGVPNVCGGVIVD
jgi:hypothetical protein